MTMILNGRTQSFGAAARLAALIQAAGAIVRTLRNRHAAMQIAYLPDELLSDVGLRRDDVHAALKADWRTDPTYLLSRSAALRRSGL